MKTRPTSQIYSDYSSNDFLVWETLFNRQMKTLQPIVSQEYLNALDAVNFSADKIPHFEEVNELLKARTGWGLQVVPNISPQKIFFEFLSQKKFTATCWLRSMEQLDYLEEPDMFHDVFGHVPLLSNHAYVDFFKGIGDLASKHIDNPKAIVMLGRVYWFTIEFGLIHENNRLKIYGAGIISSMSETKHCFNEQAKHLDFDVQTIFNTDFRTDIIQDNYFVIESFQQLYSSLPEMERLLEELEMGE